jgi:hypothetical protein
MSLVTWSWLFLVLYLVGMIAIGLVGRTRAKDADDFATARAAYGPFFLALGLGAIGCNAARRGAGRREIDPATHAPDAQPLVRHAPTQTHATRCGRVRKSG